MNDVNKLEQVKTELADAIRVWYLRHAEDIAGDAAKTIEQAARGKIAADLNITAGPAAFKVDDGRRD